MVEDMSGVYKPTFFSPGTVLDTCLIPAVSASEIARAADVHVGRGLKHGDADVAAAV